MKEEEIKETIEDVEDLVEDALDIAEDLGLVSEEDVEEILEGIAKYKKKILILLPTLIAAMILVQSQL
jgi:uncharacterized protein YlzI (FlbEa/FlbD family)